MWEGEYERRCVHPVVARWLTDRGLTYRYDRSIGQRRRPDFLVFTGRGLDVIAECKANLDTLDRAIKQLFLYRDIYAKPVQLALIVPVESFDPAVRRALLKVDIKLHGVPGVIPWSLDMELHGLTPAQVNEIKQIEEM